MIKKIWIACIILSFMSSRAQAGTNEFQTFLKQFIKTCCSNNNVDSLLEVRSPLLAEFVNNEIGVGSSNNPGAVCIGGMYNFVPDKANVDSSLLGYFTMNLPDLSKCKIFANKLPAGGFCEESSDKDGIYYKKVSKIGPYVDINDRENLTSRNIQLPAKYKNAQIMYVQITLDKWIVKKMYFVKADGKWWFVFLDKCDCSA